MCTLKIIVVTFFSLEYKGRCSRISGNKSGLQDISVFLDLIEIRKGMCWLSYLTGFNNS